MFLIAFWLWLWRDRSPIHLHWRTTEKKWISMVRTVHRALARTIHTDNERICRRAVKSYAVCTMWERIAMVSSVFTSDESKMKNCNMLANCIPNRAYTRDAHQERRRCVSLALAFNSLKRKMHFNDPIEPMHARSFIRSRCKSVSLGAWIAYVYAYEMCMEINNHPDGQK